MNLSRESDQSFRCTDIDSKRMVIRVEQGKGQKCYRQHLRPNVAFPFMWRWIRRPPSGEGKTETQRHITKSLGLLGPR
jgi:hypothetical protein